MNLSQPVTFTPPSYTRPDGEVRTYKPITLSRLSVTLMDMADSKVVLARIAPCPRPVVLWQNEEYDAAGDYTQAQAEARLLEKLGSDLKAALENLFIRQ